MIDTIKAKHIDELIALYDATIQELPAWQTRKYKIKKVPHLSKEAIWLFNFIGWYSAGKKAKAKIVDPTDLFYLPKAKEQKVGFKDFVAIILHKHKREEIIKFFSKCIEKYRDFYLKVYTRFYHKNVPQKVIKQYTDFSLIDSVEIYTSGLGELEYPIGVFALPANEEYKVRIFSKRYDPKRDMSSFFVANINTRNKSKPEHGHPANSQQAKFLKKDRQFIHQPEFVLIGYEGKTSKKFYPYDYFDTYDDYIIYKRLKKAKPYNERLEGLRSFFDGNVLFNMKLPTIHTAQNEYELPGAIFNTTHTLRDAYHLKIYAGQVEPSKIEEKLVEGVIVGLWGEESIKGFEVSHNLRVKHVHLENSSKNAAYINNFDQIQHRLVKFHQIKFDTIEIGVFKEIVWDRRPWRRRPFKLHGTGEEVWAEKCVVCGRTTYPFLKYGVCECTYKYLSWALRKHGTNTWFSFGARLLKQREEAGWEPEMFTRGAFPYKGHLLIGDAQGRCMFKEDPIEMQKYLVLYEEIKDCVTVWDYRDARRRARKRVKEIEEEQRCTLELTNRKEVPV